MPYRLRWEGHGVYRRFYDVISAADLRESYAEMINDIRYEGIRYIISDYLEARPGGDLTEEDLQAQANVERLRYYDSPDTVQAMVASHPKTVAYARYYESLHVSPYLMEIFATVSEARQWIASNPRQGRRGPLPGTSLAPTTPRP